MKIFDKMPQLLRKSSAGTAIQRMVNFITESVKLFTILRRLLTAPQLFYQRGVVHPQHLSRPADGALSLHGLYDNFLFIGGHPLLERAGSRGRSRSAASTPPRVIALPEVVVTMMRSMRFSSSRIFPGQG